MASPPVQHRAGSKINGRLGDDYVVLRNETYLKIILEQYFKINRPVYNPKIVPGTSNLLNKTTQSQVKILSITCFNPSVTQ